MTIRPLIQKNQAFGVGSVLDYSVEEDISQEEAEQKEMEYESPGISYISVDITYEKQDVFECSHCFKHKISSVIFKTRFAIDLALFKLTDL